MEIKKHRRKIYGNLQKSDTDRKESIAIGGHIWKSLEIFGSLWQAIEIYRIYGKLCKSMGIERNLWTFIEIYGNL